MSGPPASALDLLVVGHINVDVEVRVARLPGPDRTVPVLQRAVSLGGTAANIARWSARLGLKVALSSFVGGDLPAPFWARLKRDRVRLTDVVVRPREFSPVCWIFEDGRGGQAAVIDQGAMRSTAGLPLPNASLRSSRVVHLTTGDPTYQQRVASRARALGKVVTFDPAQEVHYRWSAPQLRALLPTCEILFGNEHEVRKAAELAGLEGPAQLVERVPTVVVTQGSRGATAFTRAGRVSVPSPPVRRLHRVTGAGDAFRGGFYRGWFSGEPLARCLRWGVAAGATAVATPPGPGGALPSRRAVERRVR